MPRIAKSDVHAALQRAADRIVEAGGGDKRISRADLAWSNREYGDSTQAYFTVDEFDDTETTG
jgi:hypothetical protein